MHNIPGISGDWETVVEDGTAREWMALAPPRPYTNAFVWCEKEKKMLLGYKKRGFGVTMFNGFGGKVEAGETPLEAAKRELTEEAGIEAPLEECGLLLFYSESAEFSHLIHIFRANAWVGEPAESDEMRPEWFRLPEATDASVSEACPPLPFDRMWADDVLWFPLLLDHSLFAGRVDFSSLAPDGTGGDMVKYWFGKSTGSGTSNIECGGLTPGGRVSTTRTVTPVTSASCFSRLQLSSFIA